jgi:hypothetical protein
MPAAPWLGSINLETIFLLLLILVAGQRIGADRKAK